VRSTVGCATLLTLFILAALLHHACSLCLTAALKALVLAEIHYHLLPKTVDESQAFHKRLGKAIDARLLFSKERFNSSYVAIGVFPLLFVANFCLFFDTVIPVILKAGPHVIAGSGACGLLFGVLVVFYGMHFIARYKYLVSCVANLRRVLESSSACEVDV
jgi:hypothetical protein